MLLVILAVLKTHEFGQQGATSLELHDSTWMKVSLSGKMEDMATLPSLSDPTCILLPTGSAISGNSTTGFPIHTSELSMALLT